MNRGGTARAGKAAPLDDEDFAELFEVYADLPRDSSPIVLAVSGGPDSTVLMRGAALWAGSTLAEAQPLHVATVDHALRPGSRDEAEGVAAAARALGLPHAILTWTRTSDLRASQAASREARYRLLADHARRLGATRIATAHTRDDQAETLLMRLAAGSGLAGLAGMRVETPYRDLAIVRPFLPVGKARLVATCRARGWPFVEDPSNSDARFGRSRWRSLMSRLAAEGLDADRLWRFAGRMQRADLALDAVADQVASHLIARSDGSVSVRFDDLVREPDEIALRVFVKALEIGPTNAEPTQLRLERAERMLAAFRAARIMGQTMRRTLSNRLLALDRNGTLLITPETERRRGRPRPPQRRRIHLA